MPDFGLTNKETMIDVSTWDQYRGELISGQEVWGVVELGYRPPDDTAKPKFQGKFALLDLQISALILLTLIITRMFGMNLQLPSGLMCC